MPQRAEDEWAEAIHDLEGDWATWACTLYSRWLTAPFAPHHQDFWRHIWSIQRGVRPRPFVGIWNRAGAKSSSAEMAVGAIGATGRRRYLLYVCESQDQADDHLSNIGGLLESPEMAAFYPAMATRRLGKYGPRAWRRNRLWTASGFVVDALGLERAIRGVKLESQRPDAILLDDLDSEDDTLAATDKKIRTLTKKILPAGAPSTAVIAIQNLVHENGIFARLADGRADFLVDRVVSGPIPAVEDLEVEFVDERWTITGGRPTWRGMGLAECQAKMDEWGFSAFLSEAQHETEPPPGGIFDHLDYEALRVHPDDVPELVDVVCWCDPAVTDTDSSDSHGVQVDGLGVDGVIYRLYSWEHRATPQRAIRTAIRKAAEFGAGYVGIETDQGGETWGSVFREAVQAVAGELRAEMVGAVHPDEVAELEGVLERVESMNWRSDKAGAGHGPKRARAQRMLAHYERPGLTIRHVLGTHGTLERALKRFPKTKPHDLCLAPDTRIVTNRGHIPITEVMTRDQVWTRDGWRTVVACGFTGRREQVRLDIEGRSLTGTPNHPVWTENRGWVPLGRIRRGDILLVCGPNGPALSASGSTMAVATASPIGSGGGGTETRSRGDRNARPAYGPRRSSGRASPTSGIPTPSAATIGSTSPPQVQGAGPCSTGTSTNATMDPSRQAMTFTMSTRTRPTTIPATLLLSLAPSTVRSMGLLGRIVTRCSPIWRRCETSRPSGIAATKGGNGTGSTGSGRGWDARAGRSSAWSAGGLSLLVMAAKRRSARSSAATWPSDATTTKTGPAPNAGRRSAPTSTTPNGFVAVTVTRPAVAAPSGPVWNLTVAETPEFVAGGILVHNCDAAYYGVHSLSRHGYGATAADAVMAAGSWRRR